MWLGIEPSIGLTDVLTKQASCEDALVEVDVGDGLLRVLAAGSQSSEPGAAVELGGACARCWWRSPSEPTS